MPADVTTKYNGGFRLRFLHFTHYDGQDVGGGGGGDGNDFIKMVRYVDGNIPEIIPHLPPVVPLVPYEGNIVFVQYTNGYVRWIYNFVSETWSSYAKPENGLPIIHI